MPRPKKKKNNIEELSHQVLEAVTDAYLNPTEDTADENGKMSLNVLADEFSMSRIKLRKLLITSGAYETPISRKVNELYNSGKTVKEIQTIMGLSAASVSGYLPYQKTIYNLEESTLVAERLRKYRNRKAAVHQLATAIALLREWKQQRWVGQNCPALFFSRFRLAIFYMLLNLHRGFSAAEIHRIPS